MTYFSGVPLSSWTELPTLVSCRIFELGILIVTKVMESGFDHFMYCDAVVADAMFYQ